MTQLMEKAVEAMRGLPPEEQDAMAREVLDRLAAEGRWSELLTDPRSETTLKRLVDMAREEVRRGDVADRDPASELAE